MKSHIFRDLIAIIEACGIKILWNTTAMFWQKNHSNVLLPKFWLPKLLLWQRPKFDQNNFLQGSTKRLIAWRRRSTPSRACTTTCTRRCTRSTRPGRTISSSTESNRISFPKFLLNLNRRFMKFSGSNFK